MTTIEITAVTEVTAPNVQHIFNLKAILSHHAQNWVLPIAVVLLEVNGSSLKSTPKVVGSLLVRSIVATVPSSVFVVASVAEVVSSFVVVTFASVASTVESTPVHY